MDEGRPLVFISHEREDERIANALEALLRDAFGDGVEIFNVSNRKSIGAGEPFREVIIDHLKRCRVLLALATPSGLQSRWLNFECGAAWVANKSVVPCCARGQSPGNLPPPLGHLQSLSLESIADIEKLLHDIAASTGLSRPQFDQITRSATALRQSALGRAAGLKLVLALATFLIIASAALGVTRPWEHREVVQDANERESDAKTLPDRSRETLNSARATPPSTAVPAGPESEPDRTDLPGTWWSPSAEQRRYSEQTRQPLWFRSTHGIRLVLVPPGTYTMGDVQDGNNPPHEVTLTRGFYMGATEVTNEQFRRFRISHSSGDHGGRNLDCDSQPVVKVNWGDADAYCQWLSEEDVEARHYRLPTEAEWEYACRAGRRGDAGRYPWGASWPPAGRAGNYADESCRGLINPDEPNEPIAGYHDGAVLTATVESYEANSWGIYDMGGNVWELCSDWHDPNACSVLASDPQGPMTGSLRVLRGASWNVYDRAALRSSYRYRLAPESTAGVYCGFRVVGVEDLGSRSLDESQTSR